MKLLFFTYDFPYPITSGGKNRAFHMLKHGTDGLEVTLFSFYREIPNNEDIETIESLGIQNIRLFKRPLANFKSLAENPISFVRNLPALTKIANPTTSITKKLYFNQDVAKELVETVRREKISIVQYESLYTAYYFSPILQELGVTQIFGTENIEHRVYEEYAKTAAKKMLVPLYLFESKKIKRDEHMLMKSFDQIMAVSKDDADSITQITTKPCEIVENGVDVETFAFKKRTLQGKKDRKTLLFVGNFSYFPNIPAIKNFYEQVFKKLSDNFELRIVGKDVDSLNIQDDRVQCVEYVEDIRDAYYTADIFVFPIKIGGGTNFKVVESMACGLPIVGYSDRLATMGISHKNEALFVSNGKEFVKAIEQIATDAKSAELMTHRARKFVEERYSWEVIGAKLNEYWKKVQ